MYRKSGKARTCGSWDILTDRQTDRHAPIAIVLSNTGDGAKYPLICFNSEWSVASSVTRFTKHLTTILRSKLSYDRLTTDV